MIKIDQYMIKKILKKIEMLKSCLMKGRTKPRKLFKR